MREYICIGLLAHVDAGKTTLSEALLHRTGAIRNAGRVDHGDAFLDTDSMERDRGITIFSKQASFTTRPVLSLRQESGGKDAQEAGKKPEKRIKQAALPIETESPGAKHRSSASGPWWIRPDTQISQPRWSVFCRYWIMLS